MSKIAIVGAGMVGATFAYALTIRGVASEILMVDVDMGKAEGETMDLGDGASFVKPVSIASGTYADCAGANIVVVTAGHSQKSGESRLDLVQRNLSIFKSIIPQIERAAPDAVLLVVTNPVDVMTYASVRLSSYPEQRVIGSGTVLDSSRFRYSLSKHCRVDPKNVHGYILGEHGDSEVAAWSLTNVGGARLDDLCPVCSRGCGAELKETIFREARDAAYRIIGLKGSTYYAIGLALVEIVEAILRDERTILPVSSLLHGHLGISDVCLSVPAVVDKSGISRLLDIRLSADELAGLRQSARVLRGVLDSVGLE